MKSLAFILLFLGSVQLSQAANPNHQLLVAKENAVLKTQIGKYFSSACGAKTLVYGTSSSTEMEVEENIIRINQNFNASGFYYKSWVVFQSLSRCVFERRNLSALDVEKKVWTSSMRYLQQLESLGVVNISEENDYTSSRFNYPRNRQMSWSFFYNLYKRGQIGRFNQEVEDRFYDLY